MTVDDIITTLGNLQRQIELINRLGPGSGGGGGTGDMQKVVYDTDNDGRVDAAEAVSDGTNTKTAAQVKAAHDHISLTNNPHATTAAQIPPDTTNFNGVLTGADNTVQKALDTIDNHTHGWNYGSPIRNEVPTGTINGTNTNFSLANSPATGSVTLYLNGVRLKPTDDYTISGANITMVTAPVSGDNFLADYSLGLAIEIGASSFVYNETPTGTVNSSNYVFTLTNTPISNTLLLFRDGILMRGGAGNDYTLTGNSISFAVAPETGSVLLASYQVAAVAAGNADTLDNKHLSEIIGLIYPVGSIYISTVSTNPGTLFGVGTWAAFGAGRTLVGIDAGQTEFDTVEEVGGAKTHTLTVPQLPGHNHSVTVQYRLATTPNPQYNGDGITGSSGATALNSYVAIPAITSGVTGSDQAHNNLQPYIVTYMWKRTA